MQLSLELEDLLPLFDEPTDQQVHKHFMGSLCRHGVPLIIY